MFDGRADETRCYNVNLRSGLSVVLPSSEDMVADRLARHAIASVTVTSRLEQARAMAEIAQTMDWDYVALKVREEGGNMSLLGKPGGAGANG